MQSERPVPQQNKAPSIEQATDALRDALNKANIGTSHYVQGAVLKVRSFRKRAHAALRVAIQTMAEADDPTRRCIDLDAIVLAWGHYIDSHGNAVRRLTLHYPFGPVPHEVKLDILHEATVRVYDAAKDAA
jgi:hypothetical protein